MSTSLRRLIGSALMVTSVVIGGVSMGIGSPVRADSVTPTALPDFIPNTSDICPPGTSILKFVGKTFSAGAHSDSSSGDPGTTANWIIDAATNSLRLTEVRVKGALALVKAVVISNNGEGNAYLWSYGDGVVPSVATPLVHTAPNPSVIFPITANQYFFVCAAPFATLTLIKAVQNGPALPANWNLAAAGPAQFSGASGVSRNVITGSYALSESGGPTGYSQVGWSCVNGAATTTAASVTLIAGDNAVCTVTNAKPGIEVTKTSNAVLLADVPTASANQTVTYSYAVTLAAGTSVPLGNVGIVDDKCAAVSAPTKTGGDNDAMLEVGETWSYTCAMALAASTTNTVSASGTTVDNVTVTDTASLRVTVIHPALTITKTTATPSVQSGTTVTFTVTATNTGDVPLANVVISDPKAPGCNAGPTSLAVGAVLQVSCTMVVTGQTVNVAGVTGQDPLGTTVSASASAQVAVTNPAIVITKSVSPGTVRSGDTVTYTIVVTNSGQTALAGVTVNDSMVPACNRAGSALVAGGSFSYTCTAIAGSAGVTNVATVTGTPPEGPVVTSESSASYVVVHPSVSLVKSTSTPVVRSGALVQFSIVVTNTGDVTLTNLVVSDPLVPECTTTIASLAAGASSTVSCTALANASFVNTATVIAESPVGPPVGGEDTENVTAIAPSISITKVATNPVVPTGGFVTFSITVANTGDSTLTSVTVADPLTGTCARTVGTLLAGQSVTYTCTTSALNASFTNVATVTATPLVGPTVTGSATAPVVVVAPETPTSTTTTTTTTAPTTTPAAVNTVAGPLVVLGPPTPSAPSIAPAAQATASTTAAPTAAPTTIAPVASVAGVTVLPAAPSASVLGTTEIASDLSYTGSSTSTLFLVALGMMLGGVVLVFGGKSRRSTRRTTGS